MTDAVTHGQVVRYSQRVNGYYSITIESEHEPPARVGDMVAVAVLRDTIKSIPADAGKRYLEKMVSVQPEREPPGPYIHKHLLSSPRFWDYLGNYGNVNIPDAPTAKRYLKTVMFRVDSCADISWDRLDRLVADYDEWCERS